MRGLSYTKPFEHETQSLYKSSKDSRNYGVCVCERKLPYLKRTEMRLISCVDLTGDAVKSIDSAICALLFTDLRQCLTHCVIINYA